MESTYILTKLLLVTYIIIIFYAVVQLNFSVGELEITEGGDLPSALSIVKTGQNEANITFRVFVYPADGSPSEGSGIYMHAPGK